MIGWLRAFYEPNFTSPGTPIVTSEFDNLEMILVNQEYLDSRNTEAQLKDDTMMKPWMRFFSEDGGVSTTVAGSAAIATAAFTIFSF